ncbi:MAG: zinc-ribbon and DUF3426 domain-containing protein [Steroidobacteraceae bacterium]
MFTECPTCQTMFRVTGAILRAGHGQVECGQCHTVFDAIERLIDDIPPGPQPEPAGSLEPAAALSAMPTDAEEAALASTETRWANDLPTGEFQLTDGELVPIAATLERRQDERTTATGEQPYLVDTQGDPEEITMEGDRIEISGVYRTPDTLASPPEVVDAPETEPLLEPVAEPVAPVPSGPVPYRSRRTPEFAASPASVFEPEPEAPDAGRPRTAAWALFSLVLLVALGLQAVHHYRQDLVRDPRVGPQLLQVYSALKLPLAPNWDVTGYEIQQWGVAADPATSGTLRLRASILNRAGFAQPYPLLKLTLEDRWGEQVGAREFEPKEYLAAGTPADRLLAPNQPVNADIAIVDPGADAVGFHVDVCIKTYDGIECASEARK